MEFGQRVVRHARLDRARGKGGKGNPRPLQYILPSSEKEREREKEQFTEGILSRRAVCPGYRGRISLIKGNLCTRAFYSNAPSPSLRCPPPPPPLTTPV